MMNKLLSNTRYFILIAVFSSLVAAISMLVLAGIEVVQLVISAFSINLDPESIKMLAVKFIGVIDLLLLGTVFYITALGLYELFIDDRVQLPPWLHINELDDLKNKLIAVVVVIMVVMFLENVVTWDSGQNLLYLGIAIAVVIASITFFLGWSGKRVK